MVAAIVTVLVFLCVLSQAAIGSTVSLALVGDPKYAADFEHFDYVAPDAPKGGTLRQGTRVTFDTTNGMRFPGKMPNELDFIYDSLMVRAEDEPASFYGLIARDISVTPDFARITFYLREEAEWHDGTDLTARDVAFTFQSVAEHGLPGYRAILQGVKVTAPSPHIVTFEAESTDWRLFEFVALFPIFQADFWAQRDVGKMTLDVPAGSGPYRIIRLDHNVQTVLERVPEYWAADFPVNVGRWNFDKIVTNYYYDGSILVEAMRAGEIDVNREWSPIAWLNGYDGPTLRAGRIVQSTFQNPRGASYSALVFNLRRPPLDDLRVRTALTAVFDDAFVRDSFSGGLSDPPQGHFAGTVFAPGYTSSHAERELLAPFKDVLPAGIFDGSRPPNFSGLSTRARLRRADRLLQQAGFVMRDGIRVNDHTGETLKLSYVGANASDRNVVQYYASALARLGIVLDVSFSEYVVARRTILDHEWDITSMGGRTRFPPGADERMFWHSKRARVPGYALAGAEDPALDAAIEQMTNANHESDIRAAAQAFSRVLAWQRYLLSYAQNDEVWIAHKPDIGFPPNFKPGDFHFVSTLFWAH